MKRRKIYIIGLLAICMGILYSVDIVPLDEKGPIDIGSIYTINSMVNL